MTNALSISCYGHIKPSPGKAGHGIYGVEVKSEDKTDIEATIGSNYGAQRSSCFAPGLS